MMRYSCIFTFLLFVGVSLAVITNSKDCTLPRVRYRWGSLTASQQQNYLRAVQELKAYQELPYKGASKTYGLYDIFSLTHSCGTSSSYSHGSDGFLVWHRHFLWKYETALQEVVTIYNANLLDNGATDGFLDACVTVPYWDWENDYQKETQASIFSSTTFGSYKSDSCVDTGAFANWAGADEQYCLYRGLNVKRDGGISVGAAQIVNFIVKSDPYSTFRGNIEATPHGSVHMWVGGDVGNMGNMWSPDDPLFFVHHANIDRLWALWQDCYDYEKLTSITTKVFPSTWTNPKTSKTYSKNTAMPYFVDFDGGSYPSLRFPETVLPTDMLSIGYNGVAGFHGMYYRYGPDKLASTIINSKTYSKVCKFDSWVNYTPKKRSLEQSWFNFYPPPPSTPQPSPQPSPASTNEEDCLFSSRRLENTINHIESTYSRHEPVKKLHYLALWECAEENKVPDRNYSVPTKWCTMNGINPNDWKTVCEKEGWRHGYKTVADMEEQQLALQDQKQMPAWVLPVSITAGVIVLLVIIVVTVVIVRKRMSLHEQY